MRKNYSGVVYRDTSAAGCSALPPPAFAITGDKSEKQISRAVTGWADAWG
jgi:hypothetical protein